jgi:hypothetical protein
MIDLVTSAWTGWLNYIAYGKYTALFLEGVLFLWLSVSHRKVSIQMRRYGALTAALVICPISAALLMVYQTPFYGYVWLWSLVPVTPIIAYSGVLVLDGRYKRGIRIVLLCMIPAILLLGAPTGYSSLQERYLMTDNAGEVRLIMDELTKDGNNDTICLWAPKEVMEWVRLENGSIKLPYGRNMWEPTLGAYTYDTPGDAANSMYHLMEEIGEDDWIWESSQAETVLLSAMQMGVNRILLPERVGEHTAEKVLETLAEVGGSMESMEPSLTQIEGYYIISIS